VVDPPIQVEAATWSPGGQLDWWVKEQGPRLAWWAGYAVRMAGNGGLKLLICGPRAADRHSVSALAALDLHRLGDVGDDAIESILPSFDYELVGVPGRQHGGVLGELVVR
jgi:hypothetical protein